MNIRYVIVSLPLILLLSACSSESDETQQTTFDQTEIKSKGKEVAAAAQATLLSNVQAAIAEGGPPHAISFCNLEVSGLTDSLNELYDCTISRVTAKNRNPDNQLATAADSLVWKQFSEADSLSPAMTSVQTEGGAPVFYQPILIGMPTCLKCHGTPGEDIDAVTLATIDSLYPNDQARYYRMGDLRGMWKIKF